MKDAAGDDRKHVLTSAIAAPGPLGFGDPDGVEPVRMHVPKCPQTLQEAKAQGRNDPLGENANRSWTRTAEGNEAQKPIRSHADLLSFQTHEDHPTKINRGARSDEQARGPGRSEMIVHPMREQTCEGR